MCVESVMANSSNNIEHDLWQTRLQQYEATLAASPEDANALEVSCDPLLMRSMLLYSCYLL